MADYYSGWVASANGIGALYRMHTIVTIVGQNLTANQSTLEVTTYLEKDRDWDGFYEYPADWTQYVNGVLIESGSGQNPPVAWEGWASYRIMGPTRYTVTHTDDGSKTVAIVSAYSGQNIGWSIGNVGISVNMVLPKIARATTPVITPSPAVVGTDVTIDLSSRASGSYVHTLTWACGTQSGTIATNSALTSLSWTLPDVMSEYPLKKVPIVVTAVTKLSGTVIGTKQVTIFEQASPVPPSTDAPDPAKQLDIRARLVTYESAEWSAKRELSAATIKLVDPSSATSTVEIVLSKLVDPEFPDYSVIDIDVYDGTNWYFTDHRFVLSRLEGDTADATQTIKYSGTEFVDFELGFAYTQKDYEFGTSNPGAIMATLIADAKARGWGARIDKGFDASKTSLGETWANAIPNRKVSKGTPLSQVLEGLVSDGLVEYRAEYRDNKAWLVLTNPGTGSNYATVGANPVVNLSLVSLTSAPRRASIEQRLTRVTVVGDTATDYGDKNNSADNVTNTPTATRERAVFDADVFGHLEGWVSASGVTTAAAAGTIGDNALRDNSSATNERTFEYDAKNVPTQFFPYSVFQSGDWLIIPDGDNTATDRISQITISKTVDGDKTVTVLTGDRILGGTASLAKRQSAQSGSSIAGGNQTTISPIDSRIPLGPVITSITSEGYWNTDGAARSEVTIAWNAVTLALNGAPINVDLYEVWWRKGVGGEWAFRGATDQTSIVLPDWDVLADIELRLRARSAAGIFGQFSANADHTTEQPDDPMDAPTTPIVTADALGTIKIEWDGGIGGGGRPVQFAYTRAEIKEHVGGVYSPAGTPLLHAGDTSLNPGAYGSWDVQLIAVDRLGLESDPSATVNIVTVDPGLILKVPEAVTGLSYTTDADFSPDGNSLEAWFDLEWDAVTLDTEGNPITIAGYEVWGKTGGSDYTLQVATEGTEARAMVDPGSVWDIEVRAISDVGARGAFGTSITAVANGTVPPLGTPSTPIVASTRGLIRVDWDGLIDGAAPLNSFRYVQVEYAPTDTMVWQLSGQTFLRGGGAMFIPGVVGEEYIVRLTPVDGAAVSGNQSATATVTVEGINTFDFTPLIENMLSEPRIETDAAANVGVKLFNGGIVAYDSSGDPTIFVNAADGSIYFKQGVIDGDAIVTGTILANKLDVSSLVTTLISSSLGNSLNLASNSSVNILVGGAVATVQSGLNATNANLGVMQTYYQFGPSGAVISSPDNTNSVRISNSGIDMLVAGQVKSSWTAAGLDAPNLTATQTATIGAHQFRKEGARTTMRPI
jgi:hypothetical protein